MKRHLTATERVVPTQQTSDTDGVIRWDKSKSLWLSSMIVGGFAALIVTPSWGGFVVFLGLTAVTICAGHSVGMHRLLIHRTFKAPLWLERCLVWLGTLVGMAGPFGMIEAHDMRDWHQRQKHCPPHPSHGAGFWRDAWWQLHCRFDLAQPPKFEIEKEVRLDPFYNFLERTWMAQQLVIAVPLYALGGVGWVLWGVCLRVAVSLIGHWVVGHFAHKGGHQGWRVSGLPVQGYNLPGLGLVTFGENWHGNHHAFPHSAKLGVEAGQMDPGYWLIRTLEWFGLAWSVQHPEDQPPRDGLVRSAFSHPPIGARVRAKDQEGIPT